MHRQLLLFVVTVLACVSRLSALDRVCGTMVKLPPKGDYSLAALVPLVKSKIDASCDSFVAFVSDSDGYFHGQLMPPADPLKRLNRVEESLANSSYRGLLFYLKKKAFLKAFDGSRQLHISEGDQSVISSEPGFELRAIRNISERSFDYGNHFRAIVSVTGPVFPNPRGCELAREMLGAKIFTVNQFRGDAGPIEMAPEEMVVWSESLKEKSPAEKEKFLYFEQSCE